MVTADDPSRLSAAEKEAQRLAGKASIYAMLNILVMLLVDAKILGSLQGKPPGTGAVQFYLLIGSASLKLFLTVQAFSLAREAERESKQAGDTAYRGNARGAKIATLVCGAVSLAVLVFAARQAF
jgi:PAT family beta-lactamase induction signal transducer AmpG